MCDMQHYICAESVCAATRELIKELGKALKRVKKLEQCNAQKDERIRQLEREKKALLEYIHGLCFACRHNLHGINEEPCVSCARYDDIHGWEWRGVEEEKHAED